MCFEFEALYWAKIAEEELKKKEEEQKLKDEAAKSDQRKPQPMEEPVPV